MTHRKRLLLLITTCALMCRGWAQPAKTNAPGAAMNRFVDALLKKMTLDEKIGQLNLLTSDMDVTGPTMREGYKQDIVSGKCGNIFNAYSPEYVKKLQDLAMQTR